MLPFKYQLTKRERECLQWIANGKSAYEISVILNISQRTVEAHLSSSKEKFGVSKITNLIYKAAKGNFI